jgi:hypothetical protein
MRRIGTIAVLVGLTGCSNAPLAGTLDCLFPSRAMHRTAPNPKPPDDLFRPRDRDTLPPPDMRELDTPRVPRDGRLEGLPKIGEPLETDVAPPRRREDGGAVPLPEPSFPK